MPTQMEIEYWRNRYQRMNRERFFAANTMALVTHAATQPMDLVKVRAQMMQEGKTFNGIGFQRGFEPFYIFEEIHKAGGGLRKMYSGLDAWFARTVAYTTARVWGFCYFYDWINPDPRRCARADYYIMAGIAGGFVAGVASNPVELVFTRMQADEMYPEQCRRNYRSFLHGLTRCIDEGVLLRGAVANGGKLAALCASMTGVYDWCKENSYFFLGPHWMNRLWATAVAVTLGTVVSMPFDTVRVRMHTQRPLPNGQMPYTSSFDCAKKMVFYEGAVRWQGNLGCFYSGGTAYGGRLFAICYLTQFLLDYYHGGAMVSEFWQPARFKYQTGIDYDVHEPFTDGFNKLLVGGPKEKIYQGPHRPEGHGDVVTV